MPNFNNILLFNKKLYFIIILFKCLGNNIKFVEEPFIRFKGEVLEQETMFIEDPNGNVLELKTMINPDALWTTNTQ